MVDFAAHFTIHATKIIVHLPGKCCPGKCCP